MPIFEVNDKGALGTYDKYMRNTPPEIVDIVLDYLKQKLPNGGRCAIDVGCGSGQNTACFAPFFQEVRGFDLSEQQIALALDKKNVPRNVSYAVAVAEHLPVPDNSVDLVTGGKSFHWFDYQTFYEEVDRILVPGGVVAAIGDIKPSIVNTCKTETLNELIEEFYANVIHVTFPQKAMPLACSYKSLPLPYLEQTRLSGIKIDIEGTVEELVGHYCSVAMYLKVYKDNPECLHDAFENLKKDLLEILGGSAELEDTPITIRYEHFIAMCRKPKN